MGSDIFLKFNPKGTEIGDEILYEFLHNLLVGKAVYVSKHVCKAILICNTSQKRYLFTRLFHIIWFLFKFHNPNFLPFRVPIFANKASHGYNFIVIHLKII